MGRSRFSPPDDVTVAEWHYLMIRYPSDEAEERRARLGQTIRRLARKGRDPAKLHRALLAGIELWHNGAGQKMNRRDARVLNARIARARTSVSRALASLRRLAPPWCRSLKDDDLFAMRDILLAPHRLPSRPPGRPWEWNRATENALRQATVVASDRRELMAAIGFLEDD